MSRFKTPVDVELFRRQCEARHMLDSMSKPERLLSLSRIEKLRGKPAADQLKADILAEWEKRRLERSV